MTSPGRRQRPLVCGIRIRSGRAPNHQIEAGTLTCLATRERDKKKVLVTNRHVMAGVSDSGLFLNPVGNEQMYQPYVQPTDKVGGSVQHAPFGVTTSELDLAYCELDEVDSQGNPITAEFQLYDPSPPAGNVVRRVIAPTVTPTEGLHVTMMGGYSGERFVRVADSGIEIRAGGHLFTNIIELDCGATYSQPGDSGSGCFVRDADDSSQFHLACIVFSNGGDFSNPNSRWAYAFPARTAETEMGIVFGNRPPTPVTIRL